MSKTYLIHDNGGRPFKVVLGKPDVLIHLNPENEPILKVQPRKVFVGKSPKNRITAFSHGSGSKFDGNTILLELPDSQYLYIGPNIYSFQTTSPVVDYVSSVGNSDVPYPHAVDASGQYYLMAEDVVLPSVPKEFKNDPYGWYYSFQKKDRKKLGVHPLKLTEHVKRR